MLNKTIKRFYKDAAPFADGDGFAVRLDGRGVKTPAGRALHVPFHALAEAIAAEWRAQGEEVNPHAMPLTQLASTALDRVEPERAAILDQLMGYAGTDLLCYRAEFPPDLAARQAEQWQPVLDWAAQALDARLNVTGSILAVEQPADALAALRRRVEAYDLWRLTALQSATAALGSLVLGLALVEGRLDADQAFALSILDDTFQIERWGDDAEAIERRQRLHDDTRAAGRLLELVGGPQAGH